MIIDLDNIPTEMNSVWIENGFQLPKGESLTFQIRGNPTTGYHWHFDENSRMEAFDVEVEYKEDERREGEELFTGIGGTYYFTLTASDTAEINDSGILNLQQSRDWEVNNSWDYSYEIHIA